MRAPGWYPDHDTGGAEYWDGRRWTGDQRPRRRLFAAPAKEGRKGMIALALGGLGALLALVTWVGAKQEAERQSGWGWFVIFGLVVGIVGVAVGIYLLRGQGPTTEEVEARLARDREVQAQTDVRAANLLKQGKVGRAGLTPDVTEAARIDAITTLKTAGVIRELERLLYARQITDSEFRRARDLLFGPDLSAQIKVLDELYERGALSDAQYAAAVMKLLLDR